MTFRKFRHRPSPIKGRRLLEEWDLAFKRFFLRPLVLSGAIYFPLGKIKHTPARPHALFFSGV
jgi:hypothetical protein